MNSLNYKLPVCALLGALLLQVLNPPKILADWTGFRGNNQHTALSTNNIGSLSPTHWTTPNLGFVYDTPAVSSTGNIYLPTINGLVKFDSNGNKLWTFPTGPDPINAPILDSQENVYLATDGCDSMIYSLDKDGHQRWSYETRQGGGSCGDDQIRTPLLLSADQTTLYAGVNYPIQKIYAFNLDGTIKWKKYLSGQEPDRSSITEGPDGTLYLGSSDTGYLYALNSDSSTKWYRYVASGTTVSLYTPLVDSSGNIYVTTNGVTNGEVVASFSSDGTKRWSKQFTNSYFGGLPALKDSIIYLPEKNNLRAINSNDGSQIWIWTDDTGQDLTSPVVDHDGSIIISSYNRLYMINPDGSLKESITLDNTLSPPIIGQDGLIYVYQNKNGTSKGYLYAVGSPKVVVVKYPVIFIPGIGGSEFQASQDIIWSASDGHGGTYSHAYPSGEKVWVNQSQAAQLGFDDYFDVLRLKSDGQTPEASGLTLNGNLTSLGYGDIDNFFQSAGYTKGTNFFVFTYDWRQDIRTTQTGLDTLIETAKQKAGLTKVDIVAHSMGGLVARYYITDAAKATKVNKLVELGTPHLGTPRSLRALLYGDAITYSFYFLNLPIIPGSEILDLFKYYPSVYSLNPSSKYFALYDNSDGDHPFPIKDDRDVDSNNIKGALSYNDEKIFLSNNGLSQLLLNSSDQFHTFLDPTLNQVPSNIKLYEIVGSSQPTLGQIRETWWITWPVKLFPKRDEIFINGDDTVPLYSASLKSDSLDLSSGAKIYYVNQRHSDLVSSAGAAMQAVKSILAQDNNLPLGVQDTKISLEGKQISIDSGGIDLYDNSNNHTGLDTNGNVETNIPNTFYDSIYDTKHIFIKKSSPKVKVKIKQDSSSQTNGIKKINVIIRSIDQDQVSKTTYYNEVPLPDSSSISFDMDPSSSSSPSLQVDSTTITSSSEVTGSGVDDQTPPTTVATLTGDKDSSGNYSGPVVVSLAASDAGAGVLHTEYSLDNGQTIQIYTIPFTITAYGTTIVQVKSTDKVGNEELPQNISLTINSLISSTSNSSTTVTGTTQTASQFITSSLNELKDIKNQGRKINSDLFKVDKDVLGISTTKTPTDIQSIKKDPLQFIRLITEIVVLGGGSVLLLTFFKPTPE